MLNSMYKPQKIYNFWQVTSIIRFVGPSVSWSLNEFYSLKFTFLDKPYKIKVDGRYDWILKSSLEETRALNCPKF